VARSELVVNVFIVSLNFMQLFGDLHQGVFVVFLIGVNLIKLAQKIVNDLKVFCKNLFIQRNAIWIILWFFETF
jgi:hypothetical protein